METISIRCFWQFRRGVMSIFCRKRLHGVIELGPTPPDTLSSEERHRTGIHNSRSIASLRQIQKTASVPSLSTVWFICGKYCYWWSVALERISGGTRSAGKFFVMPLHFFALQVQCLTVLYSFCWALSWCSVLFGQFLVFCSAYGPRPYGVGATADYCFSFLDFELFLCTSDRRSVSEVFILFLLLFPVAL